MCVILNAGDGCINFDELRQLLAKYRTSARRGGGNSKDMSSPSSSCASEFDLRETFDVFDKDGDGYLNAVDLRSVVVTFAAGSVKVKVNFCIAYCYETIIFQYDIVTDRLGVQPIGCRLGPRPWAPACS